jgi:hypothetical protein
MKGYFAIIPVILGLVLSCIPPAPIALEDAGSPTAADALALPAYTGGYGYDPATATMTDHNGFEYSYLPDGIIRLVLPWGYTTYFSYGLTASYLGTPQKVTALSYTWTWAAAATARYNDTGVLLGYDYAFTATNSATLAWTIRLDFTCTLGDHMKVTHTVRNGYPNALTGAEFWYLFDLTHTPSPSVTTHTGTYYPPLYADLPASITWCRLSNQFQFDWRDADYPNGHAYLGSGSVVGLPIDILGISLVLGDIAPGATVVLDPYFSGVTRTWAAGAASYSGIAASWSPAGVPATGDNITFDGTSTYACTWNTSVTLGNFSMNTGYSGLVTQSVSFSTYDALFVAGSFSSGTYWLSIEHAWVRTASAITDGRFNMTGASSTMKNAGSEVGFKGLVVCGTTTLTAGVFSLVVVPTIKICTGANLQIGAGVDMKIWDLTVGGTSWTNLGTVSGAGTLYLVVYGGTGYMAPGIISAPTTFRSYSTAPSPGIIIFTGPGQFGTLAIRCTEAPTKSLTVDLSSNNYRLSATSLTVLAQGILQGRGSNISVSNALDSSAGTFAAGTSTVYLTGTGSTVKTANANGAFYNLVVGGTYTTSSSINVTHNFQVNSSKSITVGAGKTLTAANMTSSGTVIGTGSLVLATATNVTASPGTVTTAPATVKLLAAATGERTVTLGASATFGSGLTVDSEAAFDLVLDTGGYDLTSTDLTLAADANLVAVGGALALSDDFSASGSVDASGTDFAVNDDCTLAGASTVTGGTFAVGGDLNISAALTLSPGTLTLSQDLRLSGTASVTITIPFTVTDDLVVASTADLTTSEAITVGGDWLLYDAAWTHGDQVVTLTGTCALNMTTGTFWNVTVSGTATLAEDALVSLRATVTGSVVGPGDFIEPLPVFTSTPEAQANILEVYNLTVTQAYWDALSYDGPAFLALYGDRLMGVPQESDAGIYNISLALVWNDMTVYQNWTLIVDYPMISEEADMWISVAVSLALGFGILAIGLLRKNPVMLFFSGMVWLFSALMVYADISIGWAILTLGLGLMLMIDGGLDLVRAKAP